VREADADPARLHPAQAGRDGPSRSAVLLLEHHWAVGLRDAVVRARGFRVSDGFISPLDLIGIGLLAAEEAADLHSLEMASAPT
jgi:hypothetical protein